MERFNYGKEYALFRPSYPKELFEKIVEFGCLTKDSICLDLACGTGHQSTLPLTEYFNKIIGMDYSSSQIKNAAKYDSITYLQGSSENTGLDNESVDVITVATGFHWFNIPKALEEMKRILKPGGTIAIWTYLNSEFEKIENEKEANELCLKFVQDLMKDDTFDKEAIERIRLCQSLFQEVEFPYQVERFSFKYKKENFKVENVIAYFSTWSLVAKRIEKFGVCEPFEKFKKDLNEILKEKTITQIWPVELILMKKPL